MAPHIPPQPLCRAALDRLTNFSNLVDRIEDHLSRTSMFVFVTSRLYIPGSDIGSHGLGDLDPRRYSRRYDIAEATALKCTGSCPSCCASLKASKNEHPFLPPAPPVISNTPIPPMVVKEYLTKVEHWFQWKTEVWVAGRTHRDNLMNLVYFYPSSWLSKALGGQELSAQVEAYEEWGNGNSLQLSLWMKVVEEGRNLVRTGETILGWEEQNPLELVETKGKGVHGLDTAE